MDSGSPSRRRVRTWIYGVSSSGGAGGLLRQRGGPLAEAWNERQAIRRELFGAATDRLSDQTGAC